MNKLKYQLLILLGDMLLAGVALIGTGIIMRGTRPSWVMLRALGPGSFLVGSWLLMAYVQGLYSGLPRNSRLLVGYLVFKSIFIGTMIAVTVTFWVEPTLLPVRRFYLLATGIMMVELILWRLWLLSRNNEFGTVPRVLFVGSKGLHLIDFLWQNLNGSLSDSLVGYVKMDADKGQVPSAIPTSELGHLDELGQVLERERVSHIALCDFPASAGQLQKILNTGAAHQVEVTTIDAVFMKLTEQVPIFQMDGQCDLQFIEPKRSLYNQRLRRMLGVAVYLLALPIALPLMGLAAIAIKFTSAGPVFYHQERVGKGSKPFVITKLRTMRQDAEKHTGAVWAAEDDPRITPVGRILRKTRLDELPQLFCVLKGDMSLIGPRPERPEFVKRFKQVMPMYDQRHAVRPGITGWAQVNHSYDTSEEDVFCKLRHDLYYIRNMSFGLDLRIMLRTILVMLQRWRAH